MTSKIWDNDGNIEYISLTPELLQGALEVLSKGFFPHESVSIAVNLIHNYEAMRELEGLSVRAAKDGVSIIALDKINKIIAGVAFNKLQVLNNPNEEKFFENYAKSCKQVSARGLIQFMIDADASLDLFEHCKVNCILEVMFLVVLPEYRKRGIGTKLCEVSVNAAKALKNGENVKCAITEEECLSLEPVPQLVSALFTSPISQKIGRQLKWEVAARISYEEFFHEGRSFASVLGENIPDTTLEFVNI